MTLKKLFAALAALTAAVSLHGQEGMVRWSCGYDRNDNGESYTVTLRAEIRQPWHMYDMQVLDDGPNPTVITLTPGAGVTLVGGVREITAPKRVFDRTFGAEIGYYESEAVFAQEIRIGQRNTTLGVQVEWMVCDQEMCMPPEDLEMTLELHNPDAPQTAPVSGSPGSSLWSLILAAMGWGLMAIFTPCVFPMVPMTVSMFLKSGGTSSEGRLRAVMYGVFIVALYTLPIAAIIAITRIVGGETVTADIFNWLATHWLPNVVFFAVFMLFAASFFGAFEITMPSSLVDRSDQKASRGGLGGVFFLALTLVLVSFSCTGPLVGSALISSTSGGDFVKPIVTILVFSTVFALPFVFFAFFPALLSRLPRSGGWLGSVRVVLGFLETALGLKFLSVADQTYHWGILDREIYLAIWIVVFAMLGFYLLGKLRFAHDGEVKHIGVFRLLLAVATFSFVVYLIPGMWGAPLKGISGYLPPMSSQDFTAGAGQGAPANGIPPEIERKYSDFLHLPHNLEGFFDYDQAMAYAREVGKPLLIDFTGHGCVNCREMEARVWSDKRVLAMLRDEFVIAALYSDDKKRLPESDWVVTGGGKTLKSLGKINSYLARTRFGANAQPYYLILDHDGTQLAPPRGYDLDVERYLDFLRSGADAYGARR